MDSKNMILDKQKLLDYIYNLLTKINNLNDNKVNTSAIYRSILSYIGNLKNQNNVQNINNNDSLNKLKKEIVSHLDNAGKALSNLEDTMFKATLLLSSITSIDFSKNENIYKKLKDFEENAKSVVKYLEYYYYKNKIPIKELKNYVACELLIYKFLCGLKESMIELKKPVIICNAGNQEISVSQDDISYDFEPKWLSKILERLAKSKPEIIAKYFKKYFKNRVCTCNDDSSINVAMYSVNLKYKCNPCIYNINIKDIMPQQQDNEPIWPLILKKIIIDNMKKFKISDNESNDILKNFREIMVLKMLGGENLVGESTHFIKRDSDDNFKLTTTKNLTFLDHKLKNANDKNSIIVCSDIEFPEDYPILKSVDPKAYSFTGVKIGDKKEYTAKIDKPCIYRYDFTTMKPLV